MSTPASTSNTDPSSNGSAPSIVVHHLSDSRSQRILWLLEELQLPYTVKRYERDSMGLAPRELQNVHPLGKSPVISDGETVVAESGAIVDYIINKYGGSKAFIPATEAERLAVTYWSHMAEGSLMPQLTLVHVFGVVTRKAPFLVRPVAKALRSGVMKSYISPTVNGQLGFIEQTLRARQERKSDVVVGTHLTAADFMLIFPLEAALTRVDGVGPVTKAYVQRMHERPAFKRGIEKGGEYKLAQAAM